MTVHLTEEPPARRLYSRRPPRPAGGPALARHERLQERALRRNRRAHTHRTRSKGDHQ